MSRRKWFYTIAALVALLALVGVGGAANAYFPAGVSSPPPPPAGVTGSDQQTGTEQKFDCSQMDALGIDRQMNLRAAQLRIDCGQAQPGDAEKLQGAAAGASRATSPNFGPDVPVRAGSTAIQSESFVWGNATTIVVAYNDLGTCTAGASYSTDGGTTFTVLNPNPFCSGHGTNFGDPTVVYSQMHSTWVAGWLATGCGGQGIGIWRSVDGINWTVGPCAHNSSGDDRNSMWVDNSPGSPFYGRIYTSWNDFATAGDDLRVSWSSDGGLTWSTAVSLVTVFRRDVQLTGSPDGTVFLASMDEGGGGAANRTNWMYRSTNGGVSWTGVAMGAPFAPPGDAACAGNGYFYTVNPQIRHMGWGQPAAGPANIVNYVYAGRGAGADTADIFHTRSTDNGATWSAPVRLNTDSTTRSQWMPGLSSSPTGALLASWYDRRNTANNDYERWSRTSLDGGLTWQPDAVVSDAVIPQPAVQTANCYMGDYDYLSSYLSRHFITWTDSRSGSPSQDVFFDSHPLVQGTPTPTVTGSLTWTPTRTNTPIPTATLVAPCGANFPYTFTTGTATVVAGTVDIGNACDDCGTSITLPFPVRFYGVNYLNANVISNGNLQFVSNNAAFTNACLPDATMNNLVSPLWDDLRTDANSGCAGYPGGQCGIFTSVTGAAPNRIFNIEWRAVYFAVSGTAVNFTLRFYENPAEGNRIDFIYGTGVGTSTATIGLQKDTGSLFTQYSCNTPAPAQGLLIIWRQIPCGGTPTPTVTGTPPTATRTVTSTPTPICPPVAWSTVAPYPIGILDNAAAGLGGKVYSFSGVSNSLLVTNSYVYDPGPNTWTPIAPLPAAREQASAASDGTRYIYIVGGADSVGANTNTLYRYDTTTDTYTTLAPFTTGTWAQAAAYVTAGGTSYVLRIAGCTANCAGSVNSVERFNVTAGTWGAAAAYPITAGWLMATGFGPYVYTAGGTVPADSLKTYRYDPVANTWDDAAITDLPGTRWGAADDVLNNNWILAGGYAGATPSTSVVALNLTNPTGAWATLSNLVLAKARWDGGTAGSSFVAPGGRGAAGGFAGTTETQRYLDQPCATGTPASPTRTNTVGPSSTPTTGASATATVCVATGPTWTAGASLATANARAAGVWWPANGRFYLLGGRSSDAAGSDNQNIFEYNPGTNAWVQKSATFPTNSVNNILAGQLTMSSTNYIVAVGGTFCCATPPASGDVRLYNPANDTLVTLGSNDRWPPGAISNTVPGGIAIFNNKLYMIGGFVFAPVGSEQMLDTIWEFDPARPAGSRWVLKNARLGMELGYVPATTIGNYIYTAGGSSWDGTTLQDSPATYRYDPVADVINDAIIPDIPTATGETRAVNYNGNMWVLGGGRTAPNPSNMVQVFNPGTGLWSTGPSFVTARRNFAADTDGAGRIFLVGGYTPTTAGTSMEIYRPAQTCGSVTPTPTQPTAPSPTRTSPAGATPTSTPCTIQFTDVDQNNPFYSFIRCLACRQIVSGYSDGTFRWGNNVTRGQLSKIIAGAANLQNVIPSNQQTFEDVPSTNVFWIFIERLAGIQAISGYNCGGPGEPCGPGNRPYFRWGNNATRGQISKITAVTAGWNGPIPTTRQTFEDVPPTNPFWLWIEELASRNVISGYNCGGPGEPCGPGNRPYFRWGNNATRGQMSKIAAESFFPGCQTPARPAAPGVNN